MYEYIHLLILPLGIHIRVDKCTGSIRTKKSLVLVRTLFVEKPL